MMNTVAVSVSDDGIARCAQSHRSGDSLVQKQRLIEAALERYTEFPPDCPRVLQDAIRHSLLTPGKRLRPMLVMLAAEACGGTAADALPAACAVEMIHTYSLIHDDLPAMDDDDTRRGRPTCHKVFGEAVAILAGDALLSLAFEILSRDVKPAMVAAECCVTLARASGATALVGGQADDISQPMSSGSLDLLESIHRRKTGALFLAALRMGGLVSGASAEALAALERFGEDLGLAFQITDDILDVHDDRRPAPRARASAVSDKLTYPNLIGVEQSRESVRRLVASACEALKPLGPSARSLKALAGFVSDRL